jgi:RNA polymerase sigma-70 factor, ECF subfamily
VTAVAEVLELHRRHIPLPEIAALCLTTFQRVEAIVRDANLECTTTEVRRSSSRPAPSQRQPGRSCRAVRDAPASALPSKSDCTAPFADQCVQHLPQLRRYARRLATDRFMAEDLVQDTLVLALANQHRFTPGTDLRAWLFTIIHNRRVDGVRRAVREGQAVDFAELPDAVSGEQEINQRIQELRRALELLGGDKREILLLVHYRGLSYAELADTLNVPMGTVRSRLARARRLLRDIIERGR